MNRSRCEFDVDFSGADGITVHVSIDGVEVKPEDVSVDLLRAGRKTRSVFTTSTAHGTHLVPALEARTCPRCGAGESKYIDAADIRVEVIGAVELADGDAEELDAVIQQRVSRRSWSSGYGYGYSYYGSSYGSGSGGQSYPKPGGRSAGGTDLAKVPETGAEAFDVYRRGRFVARVPAVAFEEAAHQVADFAKALGWRSSTGGSGDG